MNLNYILNLPISEAEFERRMPLILSERKYSRSFFGFLLKRQVPHHDSYDKIHCYSRDFLFFFPLWYVCIGFRRRDRGLEVTVYYYTKGLRVLDIFGIEEWWKKEIREFERRFQALP